MVLLATYVREKDFKEFLSKHTCKCCSTGRTLDEKFDIESETRDRPIGSPISEPDSTTIDRKKRSSTFKLTTLLIYHPQ